MHLVGILVLVDSTGTEQHISFLFVDSQYVLDVEGPVGYLPDQRSVAVVEVEVGPAVALGPPYQLFAVLDQEGGPCLYVGV